MQNRLLDFALKNKLSPAQATTLPALFDRIAKELDTTPEDALTQINASPPATEYVVGLTSTVAEIAQKKGII